MANQTKSKETEINEKMNIPRAAKKRIYIPTQKEKQTKNFIC